MALEPSSAKPTTLIALRHGGTHLIQPIIRHLTDAAVHAPKGQNAIECIPSPKLVVFLRDPRNRLVSLYRYKRPKALAHESDEDFATMLQRPKRGITPLAFMLEWARRWATYPDAHVMRFEELVGPDGLAQVETLREYLAASNPALAAYEYSLGRSGTWTGRHSRWEEWFGPRTRQIWRSHGGRDLVRLMGYSK